MAPKRFKAVCTETGREFGVFDLTRSVVSMPISRDGKAKWFSWDQITVYEDIEDFISKYNPELCQSTGLTDSRGQEVYEGDVTFSPSGFGYQMVVSFFDGAFMVTPHRDWAFEKDLPPDYLSKHIKDHVVIGNRWMPQAELQARAEAVSNEL